MNLPPSPPPPADRLTGRTSDLHLRQSAIDGQHGGNTVSGRAGARAFRVKTNLIQKLIQAFIRDALCDKMGRHPEMARHEVKAMVLSCRFAWLWAPMSLTLCLLISIHTLTSVGTCHLEISGGGGLVISAPN